MIFKKRIFYRTELIVVVLVTDAWLTELLLESYASFWRRSNSALFAIPLWRRSEFWIFRPKLFDFSLKHPSQPAFMLIRPQASHGIQKDYKWKIETRISFEFPFLSKIGNSVEIISMTFWAWADVVTLKPLARRVIFILDNVSRLWVVMSSKL